MALKNQKIISTLTANIFIAESMGMQKTGLGWFDNDETLNLCSQYYNTFDDLLFSESWEWLHSAVDFIESIEEGVFQVDILQEGCKIKHRCKDLISNTVTNLDEGTTKKEAVFISVFEFFQWYEIYKKNN